jgi:enediyne biosynthesis protein E4
MIDLTESPFRYLPAHCLVVLLAVGCRPPTEVTSPDSTTPPPIPAVELPRIASSDDLAASSPFLFTDVSREAGIDFVYYGNPSPEHYMTEQNGGGVALFDFDGDGVLDVFLVNGSHFDRPAEQSGATSRLFRAGGGWSYSDVTFPAGLEAYGFGMGCASGDYDNDGFPDLFICYYGKNRLYRNNGDGTFTDVTEEARVGDERWAASAAFADLDNDGLLDLYVVNYVEYSPDDPPCYTSHQPPVHISCGPIGRPGQADLLHRNLGDGRFEDVSEAAGIALAERGKGLALQIVDLDDDGLLDIYVANDMTENFLFRNLGRMQFEEVGRLWGVAVTGSGEPQAGMGVACADVNRNGRFDLFVTNFAGAVNDFYENLSPGLFLIRNSELGTDTAGRPLLGFGTLFADFNLSGWPDLFVANGHIWDLSAVELHHQYQMPPLLYENRPAGQGAPRAATTKERRLVNVAPFSGEYMNSRWLGRSAAVGDLDNDGRPDLVVTHLTQPAAILRNDSTPAGGSLRLKLIGTTSARQPLGRRVEYVLDGERFVTCVPSGGSFASSSDDRLLLSIGDAEQIEELRVFWSGTEPEVWTDLPVAGESTVLEGTGLR